MCDDDDDRDLEDAAKILTDISYFARETRRSLRLRTCNVQTIDRAQLEDVAETLEKMFNATTEKVYPAVPRGGAVL